MNHTHAVWDPNVDEDRYRNPIIHADYSDPDVVRVGDEFFMTASSFNAVPGLPILHSRDLVNWRLINHAIQELPPAFDRPQHGNGVWAPSINYHDGTFYIYYGDPDRGVYMTSTEDPRGRWTDLTLVHEAEGWIDTAPLWDDDGNAYLVHAFAKSRAGVNSVLHVAPMAPDGTRLVGESREVFDGHGDHPTIEGPKLYERDGRYYVFAPAGGVSDGWQTVLRSEDVYGPYDDRIVLAQGETDVNGPHQGAWVDTESGGDWFLHFQELDPYGRIVHLQPLRWDDGWPVIGRDEDGDGTGEPVGIHEKPDVSAGELPTMTPQTSDDFESARLGLQWQWHGNPQFGWHSLTHRPDALRLFPRAADDAENLWSVPNLLLQKFPAPSFTVTTAVDCELGDEGGYGGLLVMGTEYASLDVRRTSDGIEVTQRRNTAPADGDTDTVLERVSIQQSSVRLRASVEAGGRVEFAYATDESESEFESIGAPFQAQQGRWIGAKIGLFAVQSVDIDAPAERGYLDVEYFRVEGPDGA
ncbi:glycoside hydrolase 43 family protein [Halogeometricum sp. S1BR25-6]|uniref:Glycoside hydrolase 43 family protein n=1 Tax=Halogeometricum salsisoli TaxID=2950536 RepID=A0ABU2GI97_9EURY|nr:glycoside hydrolase 43 family protein [Halogeometricum sp. S1BR25-6]MDS0300141.1 glycoside hydrolase 43 family protein [Halogeometricum sp. S1BR25-6]